MEASKFVDQNLPIEMILKYPSKSDNFVKEAYSDKENDTTPKNRRSRAGRSRGKNSISSSVNMSHDKIPVASIKDNHRDLTPLIG